MIASPAALIPTRIGEDRIPEPGTNTFGKRLIQRRFCNPDGKEMDFYLFDWKNGQVSPSIIFPLTPEKNVVGIWQFRHGADKLMLELPGGCPKPGQSAREVAATELAEETGFQAKTLIQLAPVYFEPAALTVSYVPFLATECDLSDSGIKLDDNEYINVELIPLNDWLMKIKAGDIQDGKTITTTFLALLQLGIGMP